MSVPVRQYFSCVTAAFLLELAVLGLVLTFRSEFAELLRTELLAGLRQHYVPGGALAATWDRIQRQVSVGKVSLVSVSAS